MPILRGNVTFARYRVEHEKKSPSEFRRWFVNALKSQAFQPIDRKGDHDRAAGFAELEDAEKAAFNVSSLFYGERALFCWRVDQIKIPAAMLREELQRWEQKFVEENERKPAKSEKSKMKAELRDRLRNKVPPVTKTHDVAWNLKSQELQLWSSSRKTIDEILVAIEEAFDAKLTPRVPGAMAASQGVEDKALLPTASLVGVSEEAVHGA
ncbi:MAG: recombination-associated protein RdgC [Myxococcaceae bacterium]